MCRAVLGLFGAWFALVPIMYTVSFYVMEVMEEFGAQILRNHSFCKQNLYTGCFVK